jgi:hypothetical protein
MTNYNNPNTSERKEVLTELVGFEITKLKNTIKDLTLKPGNAIDEYAQGERKKYLSPITYFLLIFGVSFFLDTVSGVGDYIFNKGFNQFGQSFATGIKKAEIDSGQKMPFDVQKMYENVDSEAKAFYQRKEAQLLILLPGLLFCQWLFFRRRKNSFLHNSYFALYTTAHYILLLLPLTIFFLISETLFLYSYSILGFVFPIVYNTYAGINFYSPDWRKLVLKNIFLYISVLLVTSIFSGLIGIIVAVYAAIVHMNGS